MFQVSNLFARDEIDEIQQELIPVMKKEYPRRPPTTENLYDYFITRSRQNLHVVLCFSPVSQIHCLAAIITKHFFILIAAYPCSCFVLFKGLTIKGIKE